MLLFMDGFDQYGQPGQTTPTVANLLSSSGWNVVGGGVAVIVPSLGTFGNALQINDAGAHGTNIRKNLPSNYSRIIGGCRFSHDCSAVRGIQLLDATNPQVSISFDTTGTISIRTGNMSASAIATSLISVTANSTHNLEWDITIGTSANYQIWLDSVSIFSGIGNTRGGSSNNYVNFFGFGDGDNFNNGATIYDDLYLFDSTGTTNNAPLLSNPIVETSRVVADSSVQWSFGAGIVGRAVSTAVTSNATSGWAVWRRVIPQANCTINGVAFMPTASSGVNCLSGLYSEIASGRPDGGTRLAYSTSSTTGATAGMLQIVPFNVPYAATAGVPLWVFLATDTTISVYNSDETLANFAYYNTGYAVPSPCPSGPGASGYITNLGAMLFGVLSACSANYPVLQSNPSIDNLAYISDGTVGHEDLYSFANLSNNPASIAAVSFQARAKRSDSGTRTIDVHCSSNGTDSAGSASGLTPGSSFGWVGTNFPVDPNTGAAWTGTGVNAALAGPKIAS